MKLEDLPTNDDAFDVGDWEFVLGGTDYSTYSGTFNVHGGERVEDVSAERIARVDLFWADGRRDYNETDMACLAELSDGTWVTCMAWCDTTGWDCQSDVAWHWAQTRQDAISLGLDRAARERLGVSLPGEGQA